MLTNAPTLHTSRLTLRGPREDDLVPFTAWVTTSARMAAVGGNGTENDAWRGFIAGIGHWHYHGFGFFMIDDATTGAPLGRCGLLRHAVWPETELAWHLFDGAEGRGIAYEAAVAVRQWAGDALGLGPLASFISPDNTRSRALARRLGATEERETDIEGDLALVHRHLAQSAPLARAQYAEVTA